MKKDQIIFMLVILTLSIVMFSCKKKYSGCCHYQIIYADPNCNASKNIDKCYNDLEQAEVDNYNNAYKDIITGAFNSQIYDCPFTVTGEGCSFHKGKK